ncbi:restriction endonuclease subunit S [Limosilactobacillus reuteri]|uniref:restriction endonuclease subunit S n=3 Tax=Limosilactobacillus reuteri TaxID=1598 RepID=UPI0021A53C23|nr:restriction endonuclease subunit S [Limosilactobacillus reuteri]MCT3189069.1 restriction endonuclease subunit S [Limosilactobacillus reuteri]
MDKKPEKLVPEVRFKGFTDDWEQHKLGETLTGFEYGLNTPATDYDGINKYLRITDIDDVSHKFDISHLTSPKLKDDNYLLANGDILFARTGASVGKSYRYSNIDGKVYYAGFLIKAHIKDHFSTNFIFDTTLLPRYHYFVQVTSMRSGQPGINAKEYQKYIIYTPSESEQNKISDLILTIQKLIDLQQRKLKQLERLKTAMLQQLLANQRFPKVRFNDFKDSWKDYRLGEVFDEFSVKSKRENEYKLLSSTTSGMESRSGRVSGHSNIGYKVIDNGDIVLSPQNLWLGNINLNNMGKGIVSPSYHTFKIVNANPIFVNFQLKTEKMLFEYKMVSVQGASVVRRNLDMDAFKKIVIKIPNEKEQIKIASLFSSISNIINNHQNKLTQLSTLKKYLLQKMFI